MRIVFIVSCLDAGGAQRVLSDMANYWAVKGWKVTIITVAGEEVPDFYPLHPDVRRLRLELAGDTQGVFQKLGRNLRKVWRLRREIRAICPNGAISFMDVNNVLTLLATIGLGLRVIVSERIDPAVNPGVERIWAVLRRSVYCRAAAVVGQTREISLWLKEHCRAHAVTIPNPLRELPFPQDAREKMVLSVGRLDSQKGHDVLIKAFARVHARFRDWRLIVLGEGPERDNLRRLAASLGISANVDMPGRVNDPERWMARAGIVVQASRFEGFPNVVMEAMAMGAAVIATNCRSGPSELISDGKNGRLVPVDDVSRLAEVMTELMADPREREQMGHNATRIRQRLAQDKVMACWEKLLTDRCPS